MLSFLAKVFFETVPEGCLKVPGLQNAFYEELGPYITDCAKQIVFCSMHAVDQGFNKRLLSLIVLGKDFFNVTFSEILCA